MGKEKGHRSRRVESTRSADGTKRFDEGGISIGVSKTTTGFRL